MMKASLLHAGIPGSSQCSHQLRQGRPSADVESADAALLPDHHITWGRSAAPLTLGFKSLLHARPAGKNDLTMWQVWSLDVNAAGDRVVIGGSNPTLQVYRLRSDTEDVASTVSVPIEEVGRLERQSRERVVQLRYSADGTMLVCQGAGKGLDLFR